MHIFLVENHPDTLACVRRHLQRAGHEVETAQTLAETLRILPTMMCDVLLTDLGLPDGDGASLLKSLGATCPAIAISMSGRSSGADRAQSLIDGFHEHLVKPFLPAELDQALRDAAALSRSIIG